MLQVLSCLFHAPGFQDLAEVRDGHGARWRASLDYPRGSVDLPLAEGFGRERNPGPPSELQGLLFAAHGGRCCSEDPGGSFQSLRPQCSWVLASVFHPWAPLSSLSLPAVNRASPLLPGLLRHVSLVSGMILFLEASSSPSLSAQPQFPCVVSPLCVWKRASEGHDQKPQVFFHVFVFLLLSQTLPLKELALRGTWVGSCPDSVHPAEPSHS